MFRVGAWKRAEGRQLSRSPLDVLALEDRQHEHLDVEGITEALEEGAHVRRGHARAVRVPKSLEDRAELVGIEDSRHDKDG